MKILMLICSISVCLVFKLNAQEFIITPSQNDEASLFGRYISSKDDLLAVGAPSSNVFNDTLNNGSVYIFEKENNNWYIKHRIFPEGEFVDNKNDGFGTSVLLSEDNLFVGDANKEEVSIYSMKNGLFILDKKITLGKNSGIGYSLDIDSNQLVVGAPNFLNDNLTTGKVLIYDKTNNWELLSEIQNTGDQNVRGFGYCVSISNGYLAVGSRRKTDDFNSGVYLFKGSVPHSWDLVEVFTGADILGEALDLSNKNLVFGGVDEGHYLNLYQFQDENWEFNSKFAEELVIDTSENVILGDIIHLNNSEIYSSNSLGGIVSKWNIENNIVVNSNSFPENINQFDFFDFYLHGVSISSTETHLFCGATGYSPDIFSDVTGAVFIYQKPIINSISKPINPSFKNIIYPNPTHGILSVNEKLKHFEIFKIMSLEGHKSLGSYDNGTKSINISKLPKGAYVLYLKNKQTSEVVTRKIIKI